jgi:hypothetical protein
MTKPMFEQIAANLAAADAEQLASMIAMMEEVTLSGALWEAMRDAFSRLRNVSVPGSFERPLAATKEKLGDVADRANEQLERHQTIGRLVDATRRKSREVLSRVSDEVKRAGVNEPIAAQVQRRSEMLAAEHPAALRLLLVQLVSRSFDEDRDGMPFAPDSDWYRRVFEKLAKDLDIDDADQADDDLAWAVLSAIFDDAAKAARAAVESDETIIDDVASKTLEGLERRRSDLSDEQFSQLLGHISAEELSQQSVKNAVVTGAIFTGTYAAAASAGFGVFLATTTAIHAVFTGLLGLTLPFAAYTGATSFVAFLINPFVGLSIGLLTIGVLGDRRRKELARRLAGVALMQLSLSGGPSATET